jgi:chorismate dehydratase
MSKPRISVVRYLNTVPLVWGMLEGRQQGKYALDFTTPAGCAEAVMARQAHIGIIPSIEYQRIEGLEIIPGLSISSKAPVRSVLLFGARPIEEIRTVAMDNSSRTSVALLTILLRVFYHRDFEYVSAASNPDTGLERADAVLVIGDPALTYQARAGQGRLAHIFDLASEWKKFTGLPFVFAFWAGHADARLGDVQRDFEDSCSFGLTHLDEISRAYAPSCKLTPQAARIYLTENIDYTLDEENLKGLSAFYELARELGLISERRELRFAEPARRITSV